MGALGYLTNRGQFIERRRSGHKLLISLVFVMMADHSVRLVLDYSTVQDANVWVLNGEALLTPKSLGPDRRPPPPLWRSGPFPSRSCVTILLALAFGALCLSSGTPGSRAERAPTYVPANICPAALCGAEQKFIRKILTTRINHSTGARHFSTYLTRF